MFKGLGNLGNIAAMMGSLQQLPDRLSELNERMKQETVTADSACQRVTVVMNGVGEVQSVRIDPSDAREIEPAVLEATNAAGAAAKQLYADAVSQLAADMNLRVPGLDGVLAKLSGG